MSNSAAPSWRPPQYSLRPQQSASPFHSAARRAPRRDWAGSPTTGSPCRPLPTARRTRGGSRAGIPQLVEQRGDGRRIQASSVSGIFEDRPPGGVKSAPIARPGAGNPRAFVRRWGNCSAGGPQTLTYQRVQHGGNGSQRKTRGPPHHGVRQRCGVFYGTHCLSRGFGIKSAMRDLPGPPGHTHSPPRQSTEKPTSPGERGEDFDAPVFHGGGRAAMPPGKAIFGGVTYRPAFHPVPYKR